MIRRLGVDDLDEVAGLLAAGGVVAVPTDTVYGVAARLEDAAAVARLFALKNRPVTVALPVLVRDRAQAIALGVSFSAVADVLADAFWPGPLTIVVSAPPAWARRVGSVTDTLGVRVADDPVVSALLARTGPLAVTSANAHGEPPCHDAEEVRAAFGDASELDAVLDAGRRDGQPSTVVDASGDDWRVLRDGTVPTTALARALGTGPGPTHAP